MSPLIRLGAFLLLVSLTTTLVTIPPPHLPPLLPQLISGALLGSPLLDLPPYPDALQLLGLLGVSLSIVTTGLQTPLPSLLASLPRGLSIAVLGIIGPAAGAFLAILANDAIIGGRDGATSATSGPTLRAAAAAAAALAPTSLGVVDSLLRQVGEDATPLGRLIAVAAVLDDMLSLLLLSAVTVLAETPVRPWALAAPFVYAAVFAAAMLGFAVVALTPIWGAGAWAGGQVCERLRRDPPRGGAVGVWVVAAVTLAAVWAAEEAGTSFLFAAYLAGIAFAGVSGVKEEWEKVVSPVLPPLLGLFFAATTGFEIPLKGLFQQNALALGGVLGLIAVVGKMLAGFAVRDVRRDGLAVAVAMLGRGEFGFLIAIEALRTGLLDEATYASVVWGVLIPTILTPIIFLPVFRLRSTITENESSSETGNTDHSSIGLRSMAAGTDTGGTVS